MARVEIITKVKSTSPYKAVIWDILKRHGYSEKQLEYAEYHARLHRPIEWSKMIHVIIEFERCMDGMWDEL